MRLSVPLAGRWLVATSQRWAIGCDCRRFRCPLRRFTVRCNMPTGIQSAIRRFLPSYPGWFFRCCQPTCQPLFRPMSLPLSGRYSGKGKQKSHSLYHLRRKWQLLAASGTAWHSKLPHFHPFTPLPLPPSDRVQSGCLPAVATRLHSNPPGADFYVRQNIARCPLSYSKGFRLLPQTAPCPSGGGLHSEVVRPFSDLSLIHI